MKALGIDTSNYTTSAAWYHRDNDDMVMQKKLLPVAEGQLGLRQSDAVFHHVCQLPDILEGLKASMGDGIDCVGASDRPQQTEGSYMPCFLVGVGAARQIAACLHVPVYTFTHQQGHVAAALYGSNRLSLMERPFLAFHVSGGTTDALLVEPDKDVVLRCRVVAHSLDLKAGQLIDRVGGMLGVPFPAGPGLEALAKQASGSYKPRPSMDGADCHLSGVQNQCEAMWKKGAPKEEVALFCLKSVEAALVAMMQKLFTLYGEMPLVCAGGVMSNEMLRQSMADRFGGHFALPAYSADNAAGIALLTTICHEKRMR